MALPFPPPAMRHRLFRLADDIEGLALVEFAFAFPVLLILYLGAFTYSDAFACSRKVTTTARTIADLATRYSSLSQSDTASILNAGAQVLAPYGVNRAAIVLSEVKVTDATHASVVWSQALNGTPLAINSSVTIPSGIAATGTAMILGQVRYAYTPSLPLGNIGTLTFSDGIVMLPRVSDDIPLS